MASIAVPTALAFPSLSPLPSSSPPPLLPLRSPPLSTATLRPRTKYNWPAARRPSRPPRPASSFQTAASGGAEAEEEVSRAALLWRAAKLPIYSVALVPLTVGSSSAYLQAGVFFARRYFVLLFASILIITWLNLSNDVHDSDTGADQNKKESVVNIVGSRRITHFAANTSLVFGFMGLIWAYTEARDIRSILLLTFAITCGYVYQCPPFRLSYKGLGEPLCFAAFGPFATTAFYLSQNSRSLSSGTWCLHPNGTILAVSVLVGLTTTLILFCSHFHQIAGDLAVGKISPLVRIGTKTGSELVRYGIVTLYFLLFAFGLCKVLPLTCVFLCGLTLPVGKLVADYVVENHNNNVKMFMAKYYCVRLHTLFGAALAAGLLLARTGVQSWLRGIFFS